MAWISTAGRNLSPLQHDEADSKGPTPPPTQKILQNLPLEVEQQLLEADYVFQPVPSLRMGGATPPLLKYLHGVHRENFTCLQEAAILTSESTFDSVINSDQRW